MSSAQAHQTSGESQALGTLTSLMFVQSSYVINNSVVLWTILYWYYRQLLYHRQAPAEWNAAMYPSGQLVHMLTALEISVPQLPTKLNHVTRQVWKPFENIPTQSQ